MGTRTMSWLWGGCAIISTLVACEDKAKEATKPEAAKQATSAVANAAPTPAATPTEAPPAGCKAPSDKPLQLGEVHGDVFGFVGDSGFVYYSTWQMYGSRGDLGRFRKDGQGHQPLTSLKLEPRGMALDDKTVYYTSGIRLNTIVKEGGKEGTLDDKFSSQAIALDGQNVYGIPGNYGPYDRIAKIAKSGGAASELASAKRPSVKEGLSGYNSILVDASGIYVTDSGNGRVLKFALSGGKPQPLASGLKKPFILATDGTHLYFSLAGGDLMTVPKSGGKATKVTAGLVEEAHIVADAKGVYAPFTSTSGGVVIDKVDLDGGSNKPIATVAEGRTVTAMTLDDNCVYWVERVDAGKGLIQALGR